METPRKYAICYRCKSTDVITDIKAGDVICRSCGEIQSDRIIDNSNEERQYLDEDSSKKHESRTSGIPDSSLASTDTMFVSGSGRVENSYCSSLNRSMHMTEDSKQKTAAILAHRIEEIGNALHVSKHIMKSAEKLVNRIADEKAPSFYSPSANGCIKNSHLQPLAAGAVYTACKHEGYGRTLEEVSLASGVDKAALSKAQAAISKELLLPPSRIVPADLIGRIASHARISPIVCTHARHMCEMISKYGLMDALAPQQVTGTVLVVTSIYCREVVNIAAVAEGTISCTSAQLRKGYAQLYPHLSIIISPEALAVFGDVSLLPSSLLGMPDFIAPISAAAASPRKQVEKPSSRKRSLSEAGK